MGSAFFRSMTILLLLKLAAPVVAQQTPEIECNVDRSRVYEGESIIYEVFVRNVDSPPAPELNGFENFDVRLIATIPQNSSSVMIINGRRTEDSRYGTVFRYRLRPKATGESEIPAPSIEIEGVRLTGQPISVSVVPPTEQELVFLEVSTDRAAVYRLQTFEVTLKLFVRQLPGEYSTVSPLSVQRRARRPNAALTIPWLADEALGNNLESDQEIGEIVNPIIASSSDGVLINDFATNSGFLLSRRKAVFMPRNQVVKRLLQDGSEASFVEYSIRRRFQATREARIEFSPCVMKGVFGDGVSDGGRLNAIEVFAVSNRLVVDVRSPPLNGRPDSYTGAIGQFDVSATLTPTAANVGDPLTLTVSVVGQGTFNDVRPIQLSEIPEITESFRVYEPSEKTTSSGKEFTYSLRATREDVSEVPAIPFAYFDVRDEKYREVQSVAIPVTISPAQILDSAEIIGASGPEQSAEALQTNTSGLFANRQTVASVAPLRVTPFQWVGIWGGMAVLSVVSALGIRRRKRNASDPKRQRKKAARSNAFRVLAEAEKSGVSRTRFDGLSRSVYGLLADFSGRSAEGMTSRDVESLLHEFSVEKELVSRTIRFLHDCDGARYGAESADDDQVHECRSILGQLVTALERQV